MLDHFKLPDDTIVAPATSSGQSAIAVVRLSGRNVLEIADKIFKGKLLSEQKSHTLHYGHIFNDDTLIDEVVISIFKGPKSFTAEDSIEISCHGSPFIQEQIVQTCISAGARLADPGEFSMRAYLNGRIDLAQAESIADVIASQNQSQLDLAMKQLKGGLSNHLQSLRTQLLDFVSLIELELDFGEEDVEFADRTKLREQVQEILNYIEPLIQSFKYGNAIKNGIPVAIVGRPNAGKSSLLNALLNDDRAIVSEIAGTTRDTIEEELHIQGVAFRFIDTAGIRQTEDSIEKIGIEKALKKITEASVVIYIFDQSKLSAEDVLRDIEMIRSNNSSAELVAIGNKEDIKQLNEKWFNKIDLKVNHRLSVNLKTQVDQTLKHLHKQLLQIVDFKKDFESNAIVSNVRHHKCLLEAKEALLEVIKLMDGNATSDLLAFEMKRAIQSIGDITGLISNDEVLGNIFGKFCIGK
ncbi:MAG: tRNA uridine-5-carboxymethylaminomethyl(34) synthesis GTPase MnmE [Bacteroidia bacterium]